MISEGIVGVIAAIGDGTNLPLRLGRTRELIKLDERGRYSEGTNRGFTFSAMTAPAGTTIVAANNTPVAQTAATIFSIYNPLGSGVNAEVLKTWLLMVSGTPAAGMFVYNAINNQNITATPNNGNTSGSMPQSNLSFYTGRVRAFTQTALTGGVGAQIQLGPIGSSFAAAIAGTSWAGSFMDLADGSLIVPPGGLLSLASPGTGTSTVVVAGMTWMETPIQSS